MAMTKIQLTAAEAAYTKNPNIGRRNLIRACGCTGYSAARFLQAKHAGHPPPAAVDQPITDRPVRPGVSVRDFAARFDFEAKLRKTLKELCQDKFVSESDIRNSCDIPVSSFKTVAALPEFTACQMKEGGTVWWSAKANVDAVRAQARKWGISK